MFKFFIKAFVIIAIVVYIKHNYYDNSLVSKVVNGGAKIVMENSIAKIDNATRK